MSTYLLDTNVISELRKARPHGAVVEWLGRLSGDQVFLSAVSRGELQRGIELTREQDAQKAADIEHWADHLYSLYEVLPMDAACFREWARLMHKKTSDLTTEAMLAATARIHTLIVATRNERDFRHFQVDVFNPFRYKPNGHSSGA